PGEVTWLDTEDDHRTHAEAVRASGLAGAFRYNSLVFVARCLKLPAGAGLSVPEARDEAAYGQLHRYHLALGAVAGKEVLDAGSGEGYGAALLATTAASVVGIDARPEAVAHARRRYAHVKNLEFRGGTGEALPCPDGSFDVVVAFDSLVRL